MRHSTTNVWFALLAVVFAIGCSSPIDGDNSSDASKSPPRDPSFVGTWAWGDADVSSYENQWLTFEADGTGSDRYAKVRIDLYGFGDTDTETPIKWHSDGDDLVINGGSSPVQLSPGCRGMTMHGRVYTRVAGSICMH